MNHFARKFIFFVLLPAITGLSTSILATPLQNTGENGFWQHLAMASVAGFLSLLTPCVFPMVPITVSYFTKRTETGNQRPLFDAFIFTLTIILTFTLIGFLVSLIFGAAGITRLAANPWMNLFIAIVFLILAANLFGFFEIKIPSRLLTRLDKKRAAMAQQKQGGIAVTVLMAFIFTLTTFTCTVPFMGSVLVSASSGSFIFPISGMLAFSFVFSLPFFILALFPYLISRLPRSGDWLSSTKVIMGFLELAAVLKFISNIDLVFQWQWLTRDIFLICLVSIGILLIFYLLGIINFHGEENRHKQRTGPIKMTLLLLTVTYSSFLASGIDKNKNLGFIEAYLPPTDYGSDQVKGQPHSSEIGGLNWLTDYETAKSQSSKNNQPLFIDFTGYTCTNCRWMEQNMFTRPQVSKSLKNFVLLKLYTDGYDQKSRDNQKLQELSYGTVALPLYVILDSYGNLLARFDGMTADEKKFGNFLDTALNKKD